MSRQLRNPAGLLDVPPRRLSELSDPDQQNVALDGLRGLSPGQVEDVFARLVEAGLYPWPAPDPDNALRRKNRVELYVDELSRILQPYLAELDPGYPVVDIGCGDGQIFTAVFADFAARGGTLVGCDRANYLAEDAQPQLKFRQRNALSFLADHTNGCFGLISEVVTLHHLPSLRQYRRCVREMIRVTRPGGLAVFVETLHCTWWEQFLNAVLDILLNDRTSAQICGDGQRVIPVPVNFLSASQLTQAIELHGATVVAELAMKQTSADPKKHRILVCRKST